MSSTSRVIHYTLPKLLSVIQTLQRLLAQLRDADYMSQALEPHQISHTGPPIHHRGPPISHRGSPGVHQYLTGDVKAKHYNVCPHACYV